MSPSQKRATTDKDGRVVSAKDGRILVANNDLRETYKSTYRNDSNTTTFAGHRLNLGMAFKLACWTEYGPYLPVEKGGNLAMRTALFRTAAYYSMSMDGDEAAECERHPDFPEFLWILVQSAKQMRYQWLNEGRAHFGAEIFNSYRLDKKMQGELLFVLDRSKVLEFVNCVN